MIATLITLLAIAAQEKPQAKPKVEFKATLEKAGEEWVFKIKGTAELPDGTILRGRIVALDPTKNPETGLLEYDEEALVSDEEAVESFEVEKGAFQRDLQKYKRKPFSLLYRAAVDYDPDYQNNAVRTRLGEGKLRWNCDFRVGDDAKLAEDKKAAAAEFSEEFKLIKKLYDELKGEFTKQQAKIEIAAWEEWKKEWLKKAEEIGTRNHDRFDVWAVWMARQGKLRIGGLASTLKDLAKICTTHLEGKKESLERAHGLLQYFIEYYEDSIEAIGLELPIEVIAPAVAQYEKALKPLRDYVAKPDQAKWDAIRSKVKIEGSEALLTITASIGNRRRAYEKVNDLMLRFTGFLKLESAEDLKKALEEHDKLLKSFKDFAGLK